MSDMKKLLTIVTESGEKTRIDEGVNVSINVSGDSPCDVGEVLAKVTNLSSPRPVTPDMMPAPSAPPPMPMMKAIDIVGKADEPTGPAVPPAPPGDMAPHVAPEAIGQSVMMPDPSEEPTDGPSTSSQVAPPSGGVAMDGSEGELEELISQAEEELGLGGEELEEGPMDLNSILKKHKLSFDGWKRGRPIDNDPEFFRDLFDYYSDQMPYGVQKGRDGDPAYWIDGQLSKDIGMEEELDSAHGTPGQEKALKANSSYKEIHDRLREIDQALQKKNEEFKNQPNPKMSDTNYMTKDLAGGLNKPKTMHKHSYKQGDNPMAMETIVREEWQKFKGNK